MSLIPVNLKRKGLQFSREVAFCPLLSTFRNYKDPRVPP